MPQRLFARKDTFRLKCISTKFMQNMYHCIASAVSIRMLIKLKVHVWFMYSARLYMQLYNIFSVQYHYILVNVHIPGDTGTCHAVFPSSNCRILTQYGCWYSIGFRDVMTTHVTSR